MKQSPGVGSSKSNKAFIVGLVLAGLVLFVIVAIGWTTLSNTAQTAVTDPLDSRYWTPERIALSHARADAVQHGKVLIGMYAADCFSAWGKPERVDKTTTANGVQSGGGIAADALCI
jgi:hypothetical protein